MTINKNQPIELSIPIETLRARAVEAYRNAGNSISVTAVLKASVGTTIADMLDLPLIREGRGRGATVEVAISDPEALLRRIADERRDASPQVKRMLTALKKALQDGVVDSESLFKQKAFECYKLSGGGGLRLRDDLTFTGSDLLNIIGCINQTNETQNYLRNGNFSLKSHPYRDAPIVVDESGRTMASVRARWGEKDGEVVMNFAFEWDGFGNDHLSRIPALWLKTFFGAMPNQHTSFDIEPRVEDVILVLEKMKTALHERLEEMLNEINGLEEFGLKVSIRNTAPAVAVA